MTFRAWSCLMFLAGGVGAACSGEPSATETDEVVTFVGAIEGTDALAAVSRRGDDVVLYVCGGPDTLGSHTRWYGGVVDAEGVAEISSADGSIGTLTFDDVAVTGSLLDANDIASEFNAAKANEGTATALFSVVDQGCRTGVIVHQTSSSEQAAVQGAWCNDLGIFEQVTPITPPQAGATSLEVRVSSEDPAIGERELITELVDPAAF